MATRLELDDLPPRYRAQAEAQIAQRKSTKGAVRHLTGGQEKAVAATGRSFGSRGEYEYYMGTILPRIQSGEVVGVEQQRRFDLLPAKEYGNVKLPAAHYTPDFVVYYADWTVEVVEVKSKFTRRQQRDYIYRRRLFIDMIAEPKGWKFTEVVTADTADEIRLWKNRQKGEAKK